MWKKSQHQEKTKREVSGQNKAKVFSYYSSQNKTGEASEHSLGGAPNKRKSLSAKLNLFMFIVSLVVMLGCVVYVSTLDAVPRILAVDSSKGQNPHTATLPSGVRLSTYEDVLKDVLEKSWVNKSKILIDTESVAKDIEERFPELGEVVVVLPLTSRRPVVKVAPAKPVVVLANGEGAFVIGDKGRTLGDAAEYDKSVLRPLPLIQDQSGLELSKGSTVLRSSAVEFIIDVVDQLEGENILVRDATLPFDSPYDLHLRLKDRKYFAKFNIIGDSALQAGAYLAIEKKFEKEGLEPSSYVDVRVAGKVFYK